MTITPRASWFFLGLAVICFILAFFKVTPGGHELVSLGLAFFAGSFFAPGPVA